MGLNDWIEPNYFLYRDVSFLAEKKSIFFFDFLASPGAPGGSQTKNSENYIFTMKKIDFYGKMGRKPGDHPRVETAW